MSLKMQQLCFFIGFGLMAIMFGSVYPASKSACSQVTGDHFALAFSTGLHKYRIENV
jgi:hypothetical protein